MRKLNISVTQGLRILLKQRIRIFDNDWDDQLDQELKKQFVEETYLQIKKMADTTMNIFKRIIRDTCSVYKQPADRKVTGGSENLDKAFREIYRSLKFDQVMQVAHRYSKAGTACFLYLHHQDGDEAGAAALPLLRVLTPDQVYVEWDECDPSRMEIFAYQADMETPDGKTKSVWIAFSDDERWVCAHDGKILDRNPETGLPWEEIDRVNPMGRIPAVCFPAEFQIRSFWNENWNKDAAVANIKFGLLTTYMNHLVKTQSFKQIVVVGAKIDDTMKGKIMDPAFPWGLPEGSQAMTLDLNTQLAAIEGVIRNKVAAIANNYGISNENFSLTTQAQSGFSLKIANQALQDIREADIPLCGYVEQEVFVLLGSSMGLYKPGMELIFNPGEVSWPEEWPTERDRWEFEFRNGISSPIDYLIARDPQMTREAAMEYIQKRQKEIRSLKPRTTAWGTLVEAALNAQDATARPPASAPKAVEAPAAALAPLARRIEANQPEAAEAPKEADKAAAPA